MSQKPFIAFIERHEGRCLCWLEKEVGGQDARDLLQGAFLALWQSYREGKFDPDRPDAVGYLNKRIEWLLANHREKEKKQPRPGAGGGEGGEIGPDPPDVRELPVWWVAITSEARERLRTRIPQLPPPYRQVVALQLTGQTHAEIAGTLGLTGDAVRQRYRRALEKLKDLIGEDPLPEGERDQPAD
jgi:RNA polymerase sigma factor (sigma-70 family)